VKSRFKCLNGSKRRKITKKQALAARQRGQSGRPNSEVPKYMKKQNQVRRNGSPAAAAPQSKTSQSQARVRPVAGRSRPKSKSIPGSDELLEAIKHDQELRMARGTVTCVWTGPDGREVASVEFHRELFSRIERAASKMHVSLQQFFDDAIRDFTHSRENRRAA